MAFQIWTEGYEDDFFIEEAAVPDRLASHIVHAVIDALKEHRCLDAIDSANGLIHLNNATDAAIEEVEKLLRED